MDNDCDIDFMLDRPSTIQVFDKELTTIDRIKMVSSWEVIELHYADSAKTYSDLPITKMLIRPTLVWLLPIGAIIGKILVERAVFSSVYTFWKVCLKILVSIPSILMYNY